MTYLDLKNLMLKLLSEVYCTQCYTTYNNNGIEISYVIQLLPSGILSYENYFDPKTGKFETFENEHLNYFDEELSIAHSWIYEQLKKLYKENGDKIENISILV